MNEYQKTIFLSQLDSYSDNEIVDHIINGNIKEEEIQEQVKSSRFNEIKKIIVQKGNEIYEVEIEKLRIEIFNDNSDFYRNINREYLIQLVNSRNIKIEHVELILQFKENRIQKEIKKKNKIQILDDIRSLHPDWTIDRVKKALDNGEIEVSDLLSIGLNDQDMLKIFNYFGDKSDNQNEWIDLNSLRPSSTDVYMLGRPGCGKSTMLGSILFEAFNSGRLIPDTENIAGIHYMNDLVTRISSGILPVKTLDNINYISVDLRNNIGGLHKLNFIEMSGERFDEIYSGGTAEDTKRYLLNQNRKIIFFVIDYSKDRYGRETNLNAMQGQKLIFVLSLLKKWGILKYTDAVFIALNKSDLLINENESIEKEFEILKNRCNEYVRNGMYASFYNLCTDYAREFRFDFDVLPASLGKFKLANLFYYDSTASFELLRNIVNYSEYYK